MATVCSKHLAKTPLSLYNFKQWAATIDQLNSLSEWERAHILSRY